MPVVTPHNLLTLGFEQVDDQMGNVYYVRNNVHIYFRRSQGMDYLSTNVAGAINEVILEITRGLNPLIG